MGIAEDFVGMKSKWSEWAWTTKLFFIASFLLSCLSIASLADQVYQFKSFVAEGIAFWRSVGFQILGIVEKLGLTVEQWQLDYCAIIILVYLPYISERYKVLSAARVIAYCMAFFASLLVPFFKEMHPSLEIAGITYLVTVIVYLYPPRSASFNTVVLRMVLPPVSVLILAAIAEGISRPL
ncbi:hypothetical protein ACSQUR_004378 [Vibrio alginolyticus]